ncbi:hypothetical protein RA988_22640, partial [Mycobacteroides abscessus subsp. massiliense]
MTASDQAGRIRVPADLDSVTDIAEEDHSDISPAAVERIWQAARRGQGECSQQLDQGPTRRDTRRHPSCDQS